MPLRATLVEVLLDEAPAFEALSYCWGEPSPPDAILIRRDGDTGERDSLPITRNCGNALRRLRNATTPRMLWVDAICIDQTRTDDKNAQVPLMGEIYSAAERVLIWLSHAQGSARSIRKALKIIRKMPDVATDAFMNDSANSSSEYEKVHLSEQPVRKYESHPLPRSLCSPCHRFPIELDHKRLFPPNLDMARDNGGPSHHHLLPKPQL
jgi:hypothetical protein